MSDIVSLSVHPREGQGSREANRLRKKGLIPGVVYGHKESVVQVALNYDEFDRAVRIKHARTLNISLNGKSETVLIKELQWDHLGRRMVHVDLWRISKDEKVKVVVPVELRNTPKTMSGGVLDQPFHTLHVECFATSIPDAIRIDITDLTLGHPIHVRELKLPEGVRVLETPETVVVQIKLAGAEPVPAVEGGAVEPEVLTAKKPKEGEDA